MALEQQKDATEKLIANTRFLEAKMAEAKSKKDTLKARAASAKSNQEVQNLISGVSTSSALSAFEKMEEKVMGMEAQAEATGMLTAGSDLEDKFKELEGGTVDDELSQMKSKMLGESGNKGGALPEGEAGVGRHRVRAGGAPEKGQRHVNFLFVFGERQT